jgi:hypothetical protein
MSEWGKVWWCAWACHPDADVYQLERWVKSRMEMKNIAVVDLKGYRPPRGTAHYHIYVADPDHPAFEVT